MVEIQLLFDKCSNCTQFSGIFVSFLAVPCADCIGRSLGRCEAGTNREKAMPHPIRSPTDRVGGLTWGKIVKALT